MMPEINSPQRNGKNNFLTVIRANLGRYTKTVRDEEVAKYIGVHPAAFSRMLKSGAYVIQPGKPANKKRGVGGSAWTVDRWFKAIEFLGIDPHSAIDSVFGNSSKVSASVGGDETTAQIVSMLHKLGPDDSVLALLRMIREIQEQRGDIGLVLDAVRAIHKAAVPKKPKKRMACEVSRLFAESG